MFLIIEKKHSSEVDVMKFSRNIYLFKVNNRNTRTNKEKTQLKISFEEFLRNYRRFINTFHASFPFIYPLKTSENQKFPDVFSGYINGRLA